jgi:hypothetical protein
LIDGGSISEASVPLGLFSKQERYRGLNK